MRINLVGHPTYGQWVLRPNHPTQGRRYTTTTSVLEGLSAEGAIELARFESPEVDRADLARVHTPAYIQRVLDDGVSGEWNDDRLDLAAIAGRFFSGTQLAGEIADQGELLVANLAGAKHHAMADRSSGFCVFADFAALARRWADEGLKVACLDIDVHHGDGTEELTADLANVLTFSVHQRGIFPGTGSEREDDRERHVHNRPLDAGDGDAELVAAVAEFCAVATDFGADRVLIAVGGDGHYADPLGSLEYTEAGVAKALSQVRAAFPATPIIFGGAGGYRPDDYTPSMWVHSLLALAGVSESAIEELGILNRVQEVVGAAND